MEIAILTLPLHTNYGQILQCYALQTYLQRNGHRVTVLDDPLYSYKYYIKIPFVYVKRAFRKIILGESIEVFTLPYQRERENTQIFINRYIHRKVVRTWQPRRVPKYDAYVVGSDQVWRPKYFESDKRPSIEIAYLSFVRDCNPIKISYAASFGTDKNEYSEEQRLSCAKLLKNFTAISVREASAINLCEEMFSAKATRVLDPTMLLNPQDYFHLFQKETVTSPAEGDLYVYLMDYNENYMRYVTCIASQYRLRPYFCYNSSVGLGTHNEPRVPSAKPSVEQWLRNFHDASFVITDSFHGCVFSILFNKPFLALVNEGRGITRIESLLNLFGLADRIVRNYSSFDYEPLTEVRWQEVNEILERERRTASDFLSIIKEYHD